MRWRRQRTCHDLRMYIWNIWCICHFLFYDSSLSRNCAQPVHFNLWFNSDSCRCLNAMRASTPTALRVKSGTDHNQSIYSVDLFLNTHLYLCAWKGVWFPEGANFVHDVKNNRLNESTVWEGMWVCLLFPNMHLASNLIVPLCGFSTIHCGLCVMSMCAFFFFCCGYSMWLKR